MFSEGQFGPKLIQELSERWSIPKNLMFIGSPGGRLPYDLGENIPVCTPLTTPWREISTRPVPSLLTTTPWCHVCPQVVRYEVGQKYGAHRDFFNPNDYHRQPHMLRNVEYGARNRLATVFWCAPSRAEQPWHSRAPSRRRHCSLPAARRPPPAALARAGTWRR